MRILIIDDDKSTAGLLEKYLTSHGSWVRKVFQAEEGLLVLKENNIDVALVDINLGGDAMSGLELIKRYKSLNPEATFKSVAITGYRLEDLDNKLKDAGFDDYLAKPFTLAEVLQKLNYHL